MKVKFTQFLRPDGTPRIMYTDVPDRMSDKVASIHLAGFRFEIEELTTGKIHMTISDPLVEFDFADYVCDNNIEVPKTVQKMIDEFKISASIAQRSKMKKSVAA